MRTTVPTVTGDVRVDDLGVTLMHEHVIITTPDMQQSFPGFMGYDEDQVVALAHERLKAIKASGVDTIVDMTAPGLGRKVGPVARAVAGTGVNVICVTGYYTYSALPFPLQYNGAGKLFHDEEDDRFLVDLFVRDVDEGIEGTGIRAGVVKCCTDEPGVTPDVERIVRAAARTHLRTDVPIMTHTHAGTRRGLDQQRILREEGVNLSRVLIGHSNETNDLAYLEELLEAGSYLGFDRCGLKIHHPLEDQSETLVELCRRGWAGQIVLSQDRHCYTDWFPEEGVEAMLPEWNHGYVTGTLLPQLRERGVPEEQIDQMTYRNPSAFFAASAGSAGSPVDATAAAAGA